MGVNTNQGVISLPCTQNLGRYLRVKYDVTYGLALAGASDRELGLTSDLFYAASGGQLGGSTMCPVIPVNAQGIDYVVASGPVSKGAQVFGAASGKVTGSANANLVGIALDAATADGDIVRVVRVGVVATSAASTTSTTFLVAATGGGATIGLDSNSATGAFGAVISPPTLTADRRWIGVDASDTIVFVAAAQTLTNKSLTLAKVAVNNTPVAAAGNAAGNATAIGAQDTVTISSDSAAKGVKLLTGVAGQVVTLINTTATACKLYPASGGTLSGLTADAPVTIAASHIVKCHCLAADTWRVQDCGAELAS